MFKIGWSRGIKRLSLIFKWNSELERKHKFILSLNLKKLANCVDYLKIILQNEMLLLMCFWKRVLKQRVGILKHGETVNNSFSIICANCLVKNSLMHLLKSKLSKPKKNQQLLRTTCYDHMWFIIFTTTSL